MISLLGNNWGEAVVLLQLRAIGMVPTAMSVVLGSVLLVSGRNRIFTGGVMSTSFFYLLLVAGLYAGGWLSVYAVGLAGVAAEFFTLFYRAYFVNRNQLL